jgi:hypothetical protein
LDFDDPDHVLNSYHSLPRVWRAHRSQVQGKELSNSPLISSTRRVMERPVIREEVQAYLQACLTFEEHSRYNELTTDELEAIER